MAAIELNHQELIKATDYQKNKNSNKIQLERPQITFICYFICEYHYSFHTMGGAEMQNELWIPLVNGQNSSGSMHQII